MTLAAGTHLGPYEIQGPLGAGGMGEVYRARDSRLGRTVAIKVLPIEATFDEALRLRLEREAQLVSSLNHPNICDLYDIGQAGGLDFLVMEYLEGETLASRVDRGALLLPDALQMGIQIADALGYSHRKGVVHRDLKPENVMLTSAGAKLLDFGLAKLSRRSSDEWPRVPGRPALTQTGLVVGTVDYMSPEQLAGSEADARSDIFALGCVLYEAITGERAFPGESQAAVIGAILHVHLPPLSSSRPTVPRALDRIVAKCLAKSPDERWQSAFDLADELRWVLSTLNGSPARPDAGLPAAVSAVAPGPGARRGRPAVAVVLTAVAAASLGFLGARLVQPVPGAGRALRKLSLAIPAEEPIATSFGPSLALSPDGQVLAYTGTLDGVRWLYVRRLDGDGGQRLAGTETAEGPFFSPDGRWIGFFASQKLLKVPVTGGPPVEIADVQQGAGACWMPDDTIVYSPRFSAALLRVSSKGGKSTPLTELDAARQERTHRWPDVLPGGEDLVFIAGDASISSFDEARLELYSTKTRERRTLATGASYVRVLPTTSRRLVPLVFSRGGNLIAAELDLDTRKLTSAGVPVAEGVKVNPSGSASFAFSTSGDLVYVPSDTGENDRRLVWADRAGRLTPLTDQRRAFHFPTLSPDGRRVAVAIRAATYDVWLLDVARGALTRVTSGKVNSSRPVFGPGGASVIFAAWAPGTAARLFRAPVDQSQPPSRIVLQETNDQRPSATSPDGATLLLNDYSPESKSDVLMLPLDEPEPRPVELVKTDGAERDAVLSADGRLVAYVSNDSGREEVYVRPFPGPGGRLLVSRDGGRWPCWGRALARSGGASSHELFFRVGGGLAVVTVTARPALAATPPELLFERPMVDTRFDVDRETGRLLMVEPGPRELSPVDLGVVLGWLSDVNARLHP